MAKYIPPKQSKVSQIIDVIFLVALSVGALFMPLWLGLAGSTKTSTPMTDPTWETLGQNTVQAAQYEALGYTPATASDMITARFYYSFGWGNLAIMVVLIVGYFAIMLRLSEQEYRDVIDEKFNAK